MRTLFLLLALSISFGLSAQNSNFWSSANENAIVLNPDNDRGLIPNKYHTFALELEDLKTYLQEAPMERTSEARNNPLTLELPLPDGEIHQFNIYESPVMMPGISARFPHIKSYAGFSKTDRSVHVRFMYSDHGFFGTFRTTKGRYLIQPYAKNVHDNYIVFDYKDQQPEYQSFVCGVNDDAEFLQVDHVAAAEELAESVRNHANSRTTDDVEVEVVEYKMAMAGVAEWTALHGGTVSGGLSAVNEAVNLLNSVMGPEAALRFVLVDNNDLLIYTDPATDPYNGVNIGADLLVPNEVNLNATIGLNNYDIGHVMTIGCLDVGGIAGGSVCSSRKGRGVTCQGGSLAGAILNIAIHEVAHQFTAGHTWNNCVGMIGPPGQEVDIITQRASGSAYEPGSGSTIMSYFGACQTQNLQFVPSDEYYHVGSLQQMYTHSHNGGGSECAEFITFDNNIPELEMPYEDGFTIPISTPFELNATATDEDGDNLTYCWEQYNLGPVNNLGMPTLDAPSFRSFPPTTESNRTFPRTQSLLTNIQSPEEVLPTYSRNLNFRCTVRDNHPEVGGVTWEEVEFRSTESAGPFRVNYPNSNEIFEVGDYIEVLWDVANTDGPVVNCQKVDIYLSENGGSAFPHLIAQGVPNTGAHFITIPEIITAGARFKVKAADNIFFDLSNFNSQIIEATTEGYAFSAGPFSQQICAPDDIIIDLSTISLAGYDSLITFSVSGLPAGANAVFSSNQVLPSENATLTIETSNIVDEGFYAIEITAVAAGGETLVRPVTVDIVLNDFSAVAPVGPANGSSGVPEVPVFSWTGTANATSYELEIASNPSFAAGTILESVSGITATTYNPTVILEKNTLYYWRLRPENECGVGEFSAPQGFHTEVFVCETFESINVPVNISSVGTPLVESTLVINSQGTINDLNVTKIKGSHDRVSHLKVSLVSPNNTEVTLFSNVCNVATVFNMGLDDEAPSDIQCPPTTGSTFKPQGSLADFNNLQATGTWTLKAEVIDNAGAGGALQEWGLQLCSNASANAPFLVTNETMPLPPGQARQITDEFLLAQDDDNGPGSLTYTIVTAPQYGTLLFQNVPVEVGMTFRQSSLNAGNVKYQHGGGSELTDSFTFAVEDGEGGWFGTPQFNIELDENVMVGIEELNKAYEFSVFPNPAQNLLNLEFNNPINDKVEISITNIHGQVLQSQIFDNISVQAAINTSRLTNGIYFIYVKNEGTAIATEKFVIQK